MKKTIPALLFVLFAISSYAQKNFNLKDVVAIAGKTPDEATKILQDCGFDIMKGGPHVMGKEENGDLSFFDMKTGRIVELILEKGNKKKIFAVWYSYEGNLRNSIIDLEMMNMDFKPIGNDDEIMEDGEKLLDKGVFNDNRFEYYKKDIDGGGKVLLSRTFAAKPPENNEEQKYLLSVRIQATPVAKSKASPYTPAVAKNIREGIKFLENNQKRKGVKTTSAMGLQYEIIKQGRGVKTKVNDTVVVNYRGWMINGKVFSQAKKLKIPMAALMKGWFDGLQLMNKGAIYRLYIPFQLGYGVDEANGVPGGSLTIYEVELLDIL